MRKHPYDPDASFAGSDAGSVLKAVRALRGERTLPGLFDLIVGISLEETGAERAVLLRPDDGRWRVEAEGRGAAGEGASARAPLSESSPAPMELLDWALRSGRAIIIDDASNDSRFGAEPYVREGKIRSVLCYPVMDDGEAALALYLEDNRRPGAFRDEHVAFLDFLAPHVAMALREAEPHEDRD